MNSQVTQQGLEWEFCERVELFTTTATELEACQGYVVQGIQGICKMYWCHCKSWSLTNMASYYLAKLARKCNCTFSYQLTFQICWASISYLLLSPLTSNSSLARLNTSWRICCWFYWENRAIRRGLSQVHLLPVMMPAYSKFSLVGGCLCW